MAASFDLGPGGGGSCSRMSLRSRELLAAAALARTLWLLAFELRQIPLRTRNGQSDLAACGLPDRGLTPRELQRGGGDHEVSFGRDAISVGHGAASNRRR